MNKLGTGLNSWALRMMRVVKNGQLVNRIRWMMMIKYELLIK